MGNKKTIELMVRFLRETSRWACSRLQIY